jgi:excinuclease ABC subunit A
MLKLIRVKKAAQHNLKHIDVDLPRNRLIVVTGPSGSGKSSLAFDTLFAEGQRRYIECLSTYARQYMEQMEKPAVESIEGISPSISIDQKTVSTNPRSTVGTVTETYDFLRLLYARAGTPYCPECGRRITSQSPEQVLSTLQSRYSGRRIIIMAPAVKGRKGEYQNLIQRMIRKGYIRGRIDGKMQELHDDIRLKRNIVHTIEILVDELDVTGKNAARLKEAVETALDLGDGDILTIDGEGTENLFSMKMQCAYCGIHLPELEPRAFSFNSPYGACSQCSGVGFRTRRGRRGKLEVTEEVCPVCRGSRLRPESLAVRIGDKNIYELSLLPVDRLISALHSFEFESARAVIAGRIMKEILGRLEVISQLGMAYLHLARNTASLSGGEARRIRLAAQVGIRLRGVMYVLDEPTIGLHQRDNARLITLLRELRDDGNSIIVVEHDEQTIRSADHILDLGPGAGEKGGDKVAEGDLTMVMMSPQSLTSQYLKGEKFIPVPQTRRNPTGWIGIKSAAEHNLKSIDVNIPLSSLTVVTGVSGSGKSTLVYDILYKQLSNTFYKAHHIPGSHERIEGIEQIDKVVSVDQKPIGRTPRSNPATYTGLFTLLRQMFARTREARMRGYSPGRFSFNVKGGRCEECGGAGSKKIEMHFLPDVFVTCDRCGGKRYNRETLEVRYKGRNIADYLAMTVSETLEHLQSHPGLRDKLELLQRVGLGYLRLGQPAPTLSGGEAQRLKLTRELSRKVTGRTLYILDEPTTGLHFDDVAKLIRVLFELVDLGNSVIVIEHQMDVIKCADYVIDLGPEGGEAGGYVVTAGTPEQVAGVKKSFTGTYLRPFLIDGSE